jgi:hypothetical protein
MRNESNASAMATGGIQVICQHSFRAIHGEPVQEFVHCAMFRSFEPDFGNSAKPAQRYKHL